MVGGEVYCHEKALQNQYYPENVDKMFHISMNQIIFMSMGYFIQIQSTNVILAEKVI